MRKLRILSLIIAALVAVTSPTAFVAAGDADFFDVVTRMWGVLERERLETPPSDGYLPIVDLIRGQDEISIDNVYAKTNEKREMAGPGGDVLTFDSGRSAVPSNDPIEVVKGPMGYVIRDGHHEVFMSILVGAKTVAVKVVADLSHLDTIAFWDELKNRKWVMLSASPQELAARPPRLVDVRDNPERYLMSLTALKVSTRDGKIVKVKGARNAAWIKLADEAPFIEFLLAKIARAAGIRYDSRWGTQVPDSVVDRLRSAIYRVQRSGRVPEVSRLIVVDSRERSSRLFEDEKELKQSIEPRLLEVKRHMKCESLFH